MARVQRRKQERYKSSRFTLRYMPHGIFGSLLGDYRSCNLIDISGGGVAFETDEKLKQNQNLQIEIDIRDEETLLVVGKIVRVSGDDDGLSYTAHISFDRTKRRGELHKLRGYLSENNRDFTRRIDLKTLIH